MKTLIVQMSSLIERPNVSAIYFEDQVIVFIERIHDSIFCKNRNKFKYDSGLCCEGVPVAVVASDRGQDDVNAKSQKNKAQLKKNTLTQVLE